MKLCQKCKSEKLSSGFHKNRTMPDGLARWCKVCNSAQAKRYRLENKDKLNLNTREWRVSNGDRVAEYKKKYREENRERDIEYSRNYYRENYTQCQRSEYYKKWYAGNKQKISKRNKENPHVGRANCVRRRAVKLMATAKWADSRVISSIYAMSAFLTSATFGRGYHVDHIVPLNSDVVCGLHTDYNLQILRAEDNMSKSNTFKVK